MGVDASVSGSIAICEGLCLSFPKIYIQEYLVSIEFQFDFSAQKSPSPNLHHYFVLPALHHLRPRWFHIMLPELTLQTRIYYLRGACVYRIDVRLTAWTLAVCDDFQWPVSPLASPSPRLLSLMRHYRQGHFIGILVPFQPLKHFKSLLAESVHQLTINAQ